MFVCLHMCVYYFKQKATFTLAPNFKLGRALSWMKSIWCKMSKKVTKQNARYIMLRYISTWDDKTVKLFLTRQFFSLFFSLGAIFEQGSTQTQTAFKYALTVRNRATEDRKFELQAFVDVINTADAFKLSRISKCPPVLLCVAQVDKFPLSQALLLPSGNLTLWTCLGDFYRHATYYFHRGS